MDECNVSLFSDVIMNKDGFSVDENNNTICIPNWFPKVNISVYPIVNTEIAVFDKPIFLLYHRWGNNIHHNFMELLPAILIYKELLKTNNDILLCVNNGLKKLYAEICTILGIPTSALISCSINTKYKTVYYSNFSSLHPSSNNLKICKYHFDIFEAIKTYYCEKLYKEINPNIKKKIYVTRLSKGCAGANRFIKNNDEVLKYMNDNNYETIEFSEMSMNDKFLATLNAQIIITPVGANLVNLYFSKSDTIKHIIILFPVYVEGKYSMKYYPEQLKQICKFNDSVIKILKCEYSEGEANHTWNRPYNVNIQDLNNLIESLSTTDI